MLGYTLSYKGSNDTNRVKLNHLLFGRLTYKNYRGKKTAYYAKGLFDNIEFSRIHNSKVFYKEAIWTPNVMDEINLFGDIEIKLHDLEDTKVVLKTARDYWYFIAKEKGYVVKDVRGK